MIYNHRKHTEIRSLRGMWDVAQTIATMDILQKVCILLGER